jgi:hypothetical protein
MAVAQRHVVYLDVLARRDVALACGRVLLHDVREGLHLLRRDAAEGQLRADHLDVGLPLSVDTLLQPEPDELVLGGLAAEELLRLVVEVVELPFEDRDDVARDVLVDLRVVQRPLLALALAAGVVSASTGRCPVRSDAVLRGNRFHRVKVPKASRISAFYRRDRLRS